MKAQEMAVKIQSEEVINDLMQKNKGSVRSSMTWTGSSWRQFATFTANRTILWNNRGCERDVQPWAMTKLLLIADRLSLEHRLPKDVSLPFNSEWQGTISKTASHVWWLLWFVTEELAGEHRLFGKKGMWQTFVAALFLVSNYTNSCGLIDGSFFLSGLFKSKWNFLFSWAFFNSRYNLT